MIFTLIISITVTSVQTPHAPPHGLNQKHVEVGAAQIVKRLLQYFKIHHCTLILINVLLSNILILLVKIFNSP